MTRRPRQGVYLRLNTRAAKTPLYIGSAAGKPGRSFATREREHQRELDSGRHANDAMQRTHRATSGQGWRMIELVRVRSGDIRTARKIESLIIRALKGVVCNERG